MTEPSRTDQLRDAIGRCELRLKIAQRNLKECDPANERKMVRVRGDYVRARDDLAWMRNRLDEALDAGSVAFRRVNAEQLVGDAAE